MVEIERMIRSLEKTLFEYLYTSLVKMEKIIADNFSEKDEECSQVWQAVFGYFKKIRLTYMIK
ncbi:hypothetical protein COE15_07655 [Bacillus cereus]|nr:hypothetical protein CN288_24180 [Bacillus sp. AFS023182]PGY02824.1 hypothetical protein COE15_07655 [Bacillus cereus]